MASGKSSLLIFYSFCIRNPRKGCTLYLTGFAVPTICVPLTSYKREMVEKAFPDLTELDICDVQTSNGDAEIDVLIGSDYYWSVVGDENRRGKSEGLVAVNSKLGWLLSGPLKHEEIIDKDTAVSAHNMIVVLDEKEEEKKLNVQVEKFWDLDTLGIKNNEISVYDKCIEEIRLVNNRYEVRYPFKEDHPIIEDNYMLALDRLMRLKKKLNRSPNIMMKYDEIIKKYLNDGILELAENDPEVGQVTYLPHRCVIRDDKETSKI